FALSGTERGAKKGTERCTALQTPLLPLQLLLPARSDECECDGAGNRRRYGADCRSSGAIQTMSPVLSLPRNSRPSAAKATLAGRPCDRLPSSQPMAKSTTEPGGPAGSVDAGSSSPVVGSMAMATTRAPSHAPATPCSGRYARCAHGAGHLPVSKSTSKGVSPIINESESAATPEQSGAGWMPTYGRSLVAQHGQPQSSPWGSSISFSRPPWKVVKSLASWTAKQRWSPRAQRTEIGLRKPLATGPPSGVPSSLRIPPWNGRVGSHASPWSPPL